MILKAVDVDFLYKYLDYENSNPYVANLNKISFIILKTPILTTFSPLTISFKCLTYKIGSFVSSLEVLPSYKKLVPLGLFEDELDRSGTYYSSVTLTVFKSSSYFKSSFIYFSKSKPT